jgi:glycine betaine/proline transport system substrate-binding protein
VHRFLSQLTYTNDDQEEIGALVAEQGLTVEQAAQRWVDEHESIWRRWLE